MTSLPCYEILGLDRNIEQTPQTIDTAYTRLKEVINDPQILEDLDTAYETLIDMRTRTAYSLNWTPFKESEWEWNDFEDNIGVMRCLVRKTKKVRTNVWVSSDDKERRDIKKHKYNDRKGDRDKRRGEYGYD